MEEAKPIDPEVVAAYEAYYEEVGAGATDEPCPACRGEVVHDYLPSGKSIWFIRHDEACDFIAWMIENDL